ncbi:hypothetical protein K7W03_20505 [Sphingobium sp. PNB]|uniref:hypothetical protein n=1 Tax=Sphingobium sp. PNB TaxID=863934 RepID=UPI001CA4619A|nr:hypothetical protein [Sphingobium sp. PNB]MCB4861977.1 hypothetical protein [Sphingobium sp. PNB]
MLNSTLATAADQQWIRQFLAVRIELSDGYVLNLLDGSGVVTFAVDGVNVTFDGIDPIYGTLASATSFEEKIASDAPRFTVSIMSPTAEAVGSLANPEHQGSSVRAWWGIVNETTGQPVAAPELLWSGRLDFVKTQLAEKSLFSEIETVSAFDRLFVAEEGARLNSHWHQSIWPGETGLDFNIDAQIEPYWGVNAPKPAVARAPTPIWSKPNIDTTIFR